jgi:PAS domain S-box-containing protein
LDSIGRITHVNDAWRRFACRNDADEATREGVGQNYLEVCQASHDPSALAVWHGVREILAGKASRCEVQYRCHSPGERRWFTVEACSTAEEPRCVVLTHVDATALHLAETRSHIQASAAESFAARKSFLQSCRDLALVTCSKLEWDYMGIWTLDAPSWTLRCVDVWTRPEYELGAFERASRSAALGPGVGLAGRAWESRSGVWVSDRDVDPLRVGNGPNGAWMIMPSSARGAGLCSGFAFPLKCDDDVLAVIEVFGRIRERPDPALLHILEVSGAQIALAELRDRAEGRAAAAQAEGDSARERLEAVLDCAPAVVVAVDRNGAIQFVNKAPADQSKDDLVGTSWMQHVPLAEQPKMSAALQIVLAGGAPHAFDVSVPSADGRVACYANYMGPMHSANSITGAVLVSQDVTELRHAEVELFESKRLVSIGTLAAGVAHEINTPLQYIGDNIEFLRDTTRDLLDLLAPVRALRLALERETLSSESREALAATSAAEQRADVDYVSEHVPKALERCLDGLQRVTTIVRSLKEFSHPAQDEMVAVDLNRAVLATLTVARGEYKYIAELETDLGDIPNVVCHVNQINQVVLNILINATHALADRHRGTENKGVIRVKTRSEGDTVVIAIRDTAGGIPESIQPRIFDPFFTTKEVGRGTGQGLAIAWATVKNVHGGELTFESVVGQGTEFFIRLPIHGKARTS